MPEYIEQLLGKIYTDNHNSRLQTFHIVGSGVPIEIIVDWNQLAHTFRQVADQTGFHRTMSGLRAPQSDNPFYITSTDQDSLLMRVFKETREVHVQAILTPPDRPLVTSLMDIFRPNLLMVTAIGNGVIENWSYSKMLQTVT